ncbi:probable protein phosphatase 2C 55 [Jatropha curcas]|uniref:probable protein phosphatase 2C 55 n=1 Tax=Jatropha curcas TaxID=180498 RepID=UPI001894F5A4|nr:probable protein phosphatase 2C 55 [Jatropha curcas]
MITTCAKGLYFSEPRGVFFADRGRVSCFKARVRMINGELPNSPLVGSYSWFGSITRSNGNSREDSCHSTVESGQTLKLLCTDEEKTGGEDAHSVQSSAGAARDVLFDGNSREEQLSNSTLVYGQTLKLLSGSCYLPHPDKEETGGEDAHFICANEQVIGVADGVGGWADVGINAGLYARELMLNSVSAIQEEPVGSIDPARVLEKAHSNTKAKGSSTACIVALINEEIRAINLGDSGFMVNLGDSGFMVVRDGCTVFQSPAQQHCFNFPYQLESGNEGDLPSSGQVFIFPVSPGDVIVAGTDGLFDNLYNNEVTTAVVDALRAGLGPQVTAQKIAAMTSQRALDENRQTPFSTAAQLAGFSYHGGKLDDITVVVSYVTSSNKL